MLGAERRLANGERALEERTGFRVLPRLAQALGERVEALGDERVAGAERLLAQGQRLTRAGDPRGVIAALAALDGLGVQLAGA